MKTRQQKPTRYSMVLVTVPDKKTARKLARIVLDARLAACANLIPKVESHYWWKGKIEKAREVLMIFKTQPTALKALEACVKQHHPYEIPEFLVLSINHGSTDYLAWIQASLQAQARTAP